MFTAGWTVVQVFCNPTELVFWTSFSWMRRWRLTEVICLLSPCVQSPLPVREGPGL